ncbi:MAG TPA: ParB/RepB/Spo0J family partition protein [Solirubrobacterales bacterium]|nr:ParB/RepB/Spo0J family partition protein [Solirubrobacterales bacterium]
MTQLLTPELDVSAIDVEEGLNARKHIDPDALKRLADSIKRTGIVEPIVVRPHEKGRYTVTAGHRRLEAAKVVGLKQVPVVVRDSPDARVAGFVENVHREKLNAIEEAEGLEALAVDLKLATNKALAEEVAMSSAWVGSRRRLLKLPAKVQEAIGKGSIPVEAEPVLRKVAAASTRIAECVCEVFERHESESSDFVRDFPELLYAVADGDFPDPPTMLEPHTVRFSQVFDDQAKRDEYASRYRAAVRHAGGPKGDPTIRLGDPELAAARAAHVLLEYKGKTGDYSYEVTFLTDKVMAADLVVRAIERKEKEAKELEKEFKKSAAKAGESPDTKEQKKRAAEQAAAKKEQKERQEAARSYNDRVGRNLIKRRGAQSRKKFGLARMKAAAIALLLHDRTLAAAGLRLVMPQLQGLQTEAGAGQSNGEVSYATAGQANEYLLGRIDEAKSQAEIVELISDAQIAAILADDDALDTGEGTYHFDPAEDQVQEILAEEIKEVAPRRSPKQRKEVEAN